jgi:elongation factor 1-alpha
VPGTSRSPRALAALQVFSVEMHHKRVESAGPGDNVGMNIKGLDKGNMPRAGAPQLFCS